MTVPRFFGLTVGLLTLMAAAVLTLAIRTASRAVVTLGDSARQESAARVASTLEDELGLGERAISDFEQALAAGAVSPGDVEGLRRYFLTEIIALRGLTELTLTTARFDHYDDDGFMVLGAGGRGQTIAVRDAAGQVSSRSVSLSQPRAGAPAEPDPTAHDTFRTAAHRAWRGAAIWSDIAYSALDSALPEAARRKTMTVQKAIFEGDGTFLGVLRAGIFSDTLERMGLPSGVGAGAGDRADAPRLLITDTDGRLVTRLRPTDVYETMNAAGQPDPDGDLRVVRREVPPAVDAALAFAGHGGTGGTRAVVGGEAYLITLLPLAKGRAQQWLVGVVVPERVYVGPLVRARARLLGLLALVVLGIATIGAIGTRTVDRGMANLLRSTEAMRGFRFAPLPLPTRTSPFRELRGALESVERAKTALRAMVKYVPVGLVRRLYESGREPMLGAELASVSIMFTDIADFTTHAEALPPAELAGALGRYLEAATVAVEATGGIVDKYIGDALMVLWNVPDPVGAHPAAACRAALACAGATSALGRSAWWQQAGLPAWRTRFGLHADHVLVGHFGAPDRLSYTAMGDGVNLAARLEGLNKVYGTTILVSEAIRAAVGDDFLFREIDRVAVKGRSRAITIYELRGERRAHRPAAAPAPPDGESPGGPTPSARAPELAAPEPLVATYEAALHAAFGRAFGQAMELLARPECRGDGPSAVLGARCRAWVASPPPADWDGTFVATTK
jgi:adenylate cyclase